MPEGWGTATQKLQATGLIDPDKHELEPLPVSKCGVSLTYLRVLLDSMGGLLNGLSTAEFVSKCIMPITSRKKGRLIDVIPSEFLGCPQYYIIYAGQGEISAVLDGVEKHLQGTGNNSKQTYVWLDWVVMSPHTPSTAPTELSHVRELVSICSEGALVILDENLFVFNRSWCLYEMWSFVYYKDLHHIAVCHPDDPEVDQLLQVFGAIPKLDLARAGAGRPQDQTRILSTVKSTVGLKRFHVPLRDALSMAVRKIRWSKDLRDVAVYSMALLKMGEYGHLQQVLSAIPQLGEDGATLDDIRAIYKIYDTDGSGSLEEDEFIQVLATAGFSRVEAMQIYSEVNVDGDDGVDLEEFETWWINVHKAQNEASVKTPCLQKELLILNIGKMAAFLERQGVADMAEVFKRSSDDAVAGKILGTHYPNDLNSNPLRGNWKAVSEQATWKLHQGDIRQSMNIMYSLFLYNADQLAINPQLVPPPNQLEDPTELCKVLILYLQVEIALLALEWGDDVHHLIDIFQKLLDKLKKPGALSQLAQTIGAPDFNKGKATPDAQFTTFSVVRQMVALKYGHVPVSKQHVAEAEKSISAFKASPKEFLDYTVRDYLGADCASCDVNEHVVLKEKKVVRHEIPAEGPYRSVLADLGPDAQAFLSQLKESQEGAEGTSQVHCDNPVEEVKQVESISKGKRMTVSFAANCAPSFNMINSSQPESGGAFAKVSNTLKRISTKFTDTAYGLFDQLHNNSKLETPVQASSSRVQLMQGSLTELNSPLLTESNSALSPPVSKKQLSAFPDPMSPSPLHTPPLSEPIHSLGEMRQGAVSAMPDLEASERRHIYKVNGVMSRRMAFPLPARLSSETACQGPSGLTVSPCPDPRAFSATAPSGPLTSLRPGAVSAMPDLESAAEEAVAQLQMFKSSNRLGEPRSRSPHPGMDPAAGKHGPNKALLSSLYSTSRITSPRPFGLGSDAGSKEVTSRQSPAVSDHPPTRGRFSLDNSYTNAAQSAFHSPAPPPSGRKSTDMFSRSSRDLARYKLPVELHRNGDCGLRVTLSKVGSGRPAAADLVELSSPDPSFTGRSRRSDPEFDSRISSGRSAILQVDRKSLSLPHALQGGKGQDGAVSTLMKIGTCECSGLGCVSCTDPPLPLSRLSPAVSHEASSPGGPVSSPSERRRRYKKHFSTPQLPDDVFLTTSFSGVPRSRAGSGSGMFPSIVKKDERERSFLALEGA